MQETYNKPYNNSDEIDLIALLEKVISFFRRFGVILICFAFMGLLAGFWKYRSSSNKYSSKLILHSSTLTNLENLQIIESWKELLRKREHLALAAILDCDPGTVKKISSISADEIQKLYVQNNPHGFIVKVVVKDTSILDRLQKGIILGLENNEYVKDRIAVKRSNLVQLIEKVTQEIIKLDSTKTAIDDIISNKNKNSSSLMVDVSSINTELINLNEKLLAYKEELKFANAVQVLQKFTKVGKPESRRPILLMSAGFIIGFVIGYILSLFLYVRQILIKRKQASSEINSSKSVINLR
jgi:hypothetical protein